MIYSNIIPTNFVYRATEVEMLGDDSSLSSTPVWVTSDGEVKWLAPANFESNCDINIQFYPFDKQSCDIIVSSL